MAAALFNWAGACGVGIQSSFAWTTYNQAAFIGNVAMRQNQAYQKKNYKISWVTMARDDIKSMMSVSVARINNYMIVSALILGLSATGVFSVSFRRDDPEFLEEMFLLSMGMSMVFLMVSILLGVKGQNAAFSNTMKLLIHEIRPESTAEYNHDYMSQAQFIERDGIKSLFRIPGIMPRYGGMTADDKKHAGGNAKTESSSHPGIPSKAEQVPGRAGTEEYSPISDGYENLESAPGQHQQLWYLYKFSHFMRLWMPFDTYCKFTMSLGIVALGHGTTYFVLSKVGLNKISYFFSLACMVSPFLYFPMIVVADNFQFPSRKSFICGMALQLTGPIFGVIAVYARGRERYGILENICVPLCFLFHALFYAAVFSVSYSRADDGKLPGIDRDDDLLGDVIQDISKALEGMGEEADGACGAKGKNSASAQRGDESSSAQHQEEEEPEGWDTDPKYKNAPEPEVSKTSSIATGAGMMSIGKHGFPTDSEEFKQQAKALNKSVKMSLRNALMVAVFMYIALTTRCFLKIGQNRIWNSAPVPKFVPWAIVSKEWKVQWSSAPFFMPNSLGCHGKEIFLADRYHVFTLENGKNLHQMCKFNEPILDMVSFCEDVDGPCRPLVLVQKVVGKDKVVDFRECGKGNHSSELKQTLGEVTKAGTYIRRDKGVVSHMLVTGHGKDLLQSRLSKDGKRWEPDWALGPVESDSLRTISAAADILMLFSSRSIEARSSSSQERVGKWQLPPGIGDLHGGCRMPNTVKALSLVEGGRDDQPRLLELELPALENAVPESDRPHSKESARPEANAHSLLGRHQHTRSLGGVLGLDVETDDANFTGTLKRVLGQENGHHLVKGPWRKGS